MNTLFEEQERAINKLINARGGIAWWRVGQGKTRIGIYTILGLMQVYKSEFPCICLVVVKPSAMYDFRRELQLLDIDAVVLEGSADGLPEQVQFAMLQKPTFLIVSSGKIVQSHTHFPVDRRIRYMIVDELYLYKNPQSARSKAIQYLSLRLKTVGLSGSIMTVQGQIEDIYGQLMAVQKHRLVAQSFTKFRGEFINMRQIEKKVGGSFPLRTPVPGAYKKIMERAADSIDVYFPPNSDRKIKLKLIPIPSTFEQQAEFSALRDWMEVKLTGQELNSTLQVALKIQQIACGWVQDPDGNFHEVNSHKHSQLIADAQTLIEQGEKLIVFCAFRHDVEFLTKKFQSAGFATLQFMSGQPFDINAWNTGKFNVVLATEAMGNSVNHFEQVAYAAYFSMDYKWLDLQQSQGRTDRRASKHDTCYYFHYHVQDSIDRKIYDRVMSSKRSEQTLILLGEDVRAWLRKR